MGDVASIDKELFRNVHTNSTEVSGDVLSGPERRRRWSTEEKLRVLAQSVAPGSSPTLACRMCGISRGQLSTWRKQFRSGDLTGFVPISVIADAPLEQPSAPATAAEPEPVLVGMMEVELRSASLSIAATSPIRPTAQAWRPA